MRKRERKKERDKEREREEQYVLYLFPIEDERLFHGDFREIAKRIQTKNT